MTFENHVKKSVAKYPSLYRTDDFEQSSLLVMNHTFQVLGNGLSWAGENGYITDMQYGQESDNIYVNEAICDVAFEMVWGLPYTLDFEGVDGHKWYTDASSYLSHPYPCFQKKYSCFWEGGFDFIQLDWLQAGIRWIKWCQEFFADSTRVTLYGNYHLSPANQRGLKESVLDKMNEHGWSVDKVRTEYICPIFTGDNWEEFSTYRWEQELKSVNEYLSETLERLENKKKEYV